MKSVKNLILRKSSGKKVGLFSNLAKYFQFLLSKRSHKQSWRNCSYYSIWLLMLSIQLVLKISFLTIKRYFREFKCQNILPIGKNCPRKNFWSFILAWNIHKWPLQRGWKGKWGCKYSCLLFNLPFYFPKMPFIPIITLLFSRSALLFPRITLLFSRIAFSFKKVPSFDSLCTSAWKMQFLSI